MLATMPSLLALGVPAGAGLMLYAVAGRSATWLAPSVWKGPADRKEIALTFDDGPSESTPELLDILSRNGVHATFFQNGANIRRVPSIANDVRFEGHEIGNHGDMHPYYYLKSPAFIEADIERCQRTIEDVHGLSPRWFRPPYGLRWFGMRSIYSRFRLTGVQWTVIGWDWSWNSDRVVKFVVPRVKNGAIICLHDGREIKPKPDIRNTLTAVSRLVPMLKDQGFSFRTMSEMFPIGTKF